MKKLDLCGQWQMRQVSREQWLPAQIPGSVVSALLAENRMPDPYWRDNEKIVQELFLEDYLLTRSFRVEEAFLKSQNIDLVCEGLDTVAELTLNGIALGNADNMHVTWRFACKDALRSGENTLTVRFRSPIQYLKEHPAPIGKRFTTIRKAACMFGWDWGLDLSDCGIWRPVYLEGYDHGRLTPAVVRQHHSDDGVTVRMTPGAEEFCAGSSIRVTLEDPQGNWLQVKTARPGEEVSFFIPEPQLWWPAGYGTQPLYRLITELVHGEEVCHRREERIGLRTVVLDRSPREDGVTYQFLVNGVSVFFRGENLIIPDSILSRTDESYWKKLISNCLKSNLNGIRVWGGAYYPPDIFYELCDEAGILVYQDAMFACSFYAVTPELLRNVRRELEDNLSRISHHACLALLCGNNEIDGIYTVGASRDPETAALRVLFGAGPDPLPEKTRQFLWSQYKPLFLELIPELAEKWMPDVSYVPSSPSLPEPGAAESFFDYLPRGDMHYYLQYNGNAPYQKMRAMRSRFMTEIGFQSYPDWKTICSFTEPQDRLPYTPVMYAHQKCASGNETIELYMERDYAVPKDFRDYVFLSQVQAGQIMAYTAEHFRRDSGYCRGMVLWQLNDCWPVVSWSGIDYYGRWKALQYYIRRFYAPVLLSAEDTQTCVDLWLSNETLRDARGILRWQLWRADEVLQQGETEVLTPAGQSHAPVKLDFGDVLTPENRADAYLRFSYESGGEVQSGTVLFVLPKEFRFQQPGISWDTCDDAESIVLRIRAEKFTRCLGLTTREGDCIFPDNYFDFSPGEERLLRISREDCTGIRSAEELAAVLEVNSLNQVMLRTKEA